MIRFPVSLAMVLFSLAAAVRAESFPSFQPTDRVLIFAPHPDDEVLCCGGLIQQLSNQHIPVSIVFFTYGDNNAWAFTLYRHSPVFRPHTMLAMGAVRHDEAIAAAQVLGLSPDQLVFLGYPDYGTLTIWKDHWDAAPAYESHMTHVRAVPYSTAYRPGAAYKAEEIVRDLDDLLLRFHPTTIIVPHPLDSRPDHQALALFIHSVLKKVSPDNRPREYTYLVHFPGWPSHGGLHPKEALEPPAAIGGNLHWLTLSLTPQEVDKKYEALQKHQTQWAYSRHSMKSLVRTNELFSEED